MREIGRADSPEISDWHRRTCVSPALPNLSFGRPGKRVGRAACGFRSALHTRPIRLLLIPIAQIWELTLGKRARGASFSAKAVRCLVQLAFERMMLAEIAVFIANIHVEIA